MPATERTRARPAASVTTPSLTRHLTIFFPGRPLQGPEDDALDNKHAKGVARRYVDFLIEKAEQAGTLHCAPDLIRKQLESSLKEHSSFGISVGAFLGLRLRVVIVLYAEHIAVSYLLDNDHLDESDHVFATKCIPKIGILVDYLLPKLRIFEAETAYERGGDSLGYKLTACKDNFSTIYEYMNDVIYRETWVALDIFLRNNIFITEFGNDTVKGDIRGLALTADPSCGLIVDTQIFTDLQRSSPPMIDSPPNNAQRPKIEEFLRSQDAFFSTTLGIGYSMHLVGGNQPMMKWDTNHVLCYMSGRAIIYGSGLVVRTHKKPNELTPAEVRAKDYDYVRTFIIFDGTNNYSLGRVIRRLHVLSELRIMTFVERRHIASAHDALREIGYELSCLVDDMTGRYGEAAEKNVEPFEMLDIGRLNRIVDAFNSIGKRRMHGGETGTYKGYTFDKCHGGLSYRISRSKYYWESFLNRMKDLRVEPIKGAQSYERFVSRNYNQQMQSILSIGERVALLGQRIDRAITISHTLQTRKLAHYAVVVAACLSVFPALSTVNGATPIFVDYFHKSTMEVWSYLAFGVVALIFTGVMLLRWSLKRVGLYVRRNPIR